MCLVNISKKITTNNMKITRLKGIVNFFSIDFNPVDINHILDIHKYLMEGKQFKIMLGIIKNMVIVVLTSTVSASNHTKCVSLSNQKCMIQPTVNLLLIYILMNTVKNFTIIHFQLKQIDLLKVVTLLMTYLIKYVYQIKQKI